MARNDAVRQETSWWRALAAAGVSYLVLGILTATAGLAATMWFAGGFLIASLVGLYEAGRNALREEQAFPQSDTIEEEVKR